MKILTEIGMFQSRIRILERNLGILIAVERANAAWFGDSQLDAIVTEIRNNTSDAIALAKEKIRWLEISVQKLLDEIEEEDHVGIPDYAPEAKV